MTLSVEVEDTLRAMAVYEEKYKAEFQVDRETGLFLFDIVRRLKPRRILELGTWRGASAIYMAAALKLNGQGVLTTVDSDNSGNSKMALDNFRRSGLISFISLVSMYIDDFLADHQEKYDLVFMDAAKKKQAGWLEILLRCNLNQDGIIIIDDAATMKDRLHELYAYINSSDNVKSSLVPIGGGLMMVTLK